MFELNPIGGGTGPFLETKAVGHRGGVPARRTPVGAEQTASGYEVAWSVPGAERIRGLEHQQRRQLHQHRHGNSDWRQLGAGGGGSQLWRGPTPAPGRATPATIATNGAITGCRLASVRTEPRQRRYGTVLKLNGSLVTAGQFPAGWTPVGAEKTASGYEVAWSVPGQNEYVVWNTDSNGDSQARPQGFCRARARSWRRSKPIRRGPSPAPERRRRPRLRRTA